MSAETPPLDEEISQLEAQIDQPISWHDEPRHGSGSTRRKANGSWNVPRSFYSDEDHLTDQNSHLAEILELSTRAKILSGSVKTIVLGFMSCLISSSSA